jgi:anti-sigma B factor antagonist
VSLQLETTKVEPGITVIRLVGSLIEGPEAYALERLVYDLVGRGEKKLILDLGGVSRIDSGGARSVIQSFFNMREAMGGLRLAGATPKVERLFRITQLDTLLPFYRSVAAAAEHFELAKGA